jgi:hypothetical protein
MIVLRALLMMAAASALLFAAPVRAQDCSGGVFFVSAAVVGASAIYDIATASKSARHYNQTHLSVTPLVNPRRGSYGVMASWSFGRSRRAPAAAKSPSTAFQLSFFSTVVPMGAGALALASSDNEAGALVFLGGLVVGPSVGHFYAGQVGRGIGTTLLRGAGTAIGVGSIIPCFDD